MDRNESVEETEDHEPTNRLLSGWSSSSLGISIETHSADLAIISGKEKMQKMQKMQNEERGEIGEREEEGAKEEQRDGEEDRKGKQCKEKGEEGMG